MGGKFSKNRIDSSKQLPELGLSNNTFVIDITFVYNNLIL